ncbi:MAG: SMC-Scp complex subunit ScpB [Dehalococcoidia bacterium]
MTEGTPPTGPRDLLHPDAFVWGGSPEPPAVVAATQAAAERAAEEAAAGEAEPGDRAGEPASEHESAPSEDAGKAPGDGDADESAEGTAAAEGAGAGRPAPPIEQVQSIIEALLFVADGPVAPASLAKVIGLPPRSIEGPIEALAEALRARGLRLQRGPEGVQLVTAPFASTYVEQFLGLESAKRLSTAALETLAIVAYRQPVTRGQVEAIRGVNSDAALDTLRTRGLVDIIGRADTAGRPAIFGTTQRFLEHFGLERPEDLPPLPEEVAGIAAARFRDHGAQLPLPPTPPRGHLEPAVVEAPEPREVSGPSLPATEPEQRRPAAEPGPRLPTSGTSLPQTLPGAPPPRMPGGGPPRSGPPGGGPPRVP